jgi:hypothetical protein
MEQQHLAPTGTMYRPVLAGDADRTQLTKMRATGVLRDCVGEIREGIVIPQL